MQKIKLLLFSAFVAIVTIGGYAQELPKDGIIIKMDDYNLDLAAGKTTAKVYFVRSKRLSKVKLEAPTVKSNQGYDIVFEPLQDEKDAYLMTVKADQVVKNDVTLIIDGAGRWRHKIQSATFSVGGTAAVSQNE